MTIHVHASKTELPRTVKLLAPLSQDLAEWRLASGRPEPAALIFPTHDGDDWKLHDWQNWRRRIYQPPARKAGVQETSACTASEDRSCPFSFGRDEA